MPVKFFFFLWRLHEARNSEGQRNIRQAGNNRVICQIWTPQNVNFPDEKGPSRPTQIFPNKGVRWKSGFISIVQFAAWFNHDLIELSHITRFKAKRLCSKSHSREVWRLARDKTKSNRLKKKKKSKFQRAFFGEWSESGDGRWTGLEHTALHSLVGAVRDVQLTLARSNSGKELRSPDMGNLESGRGSLQIVTRYNDGGA
jgi:hypothetical protein